MPKTSVALVGCAHIHTPQFLDRLRQRNDIEVTAVWDHVAHRGEACAAKLGAPVSSNVGEIWNDPKTQAAVICSETVYHAELVEAGAAAKKHLFVEKPLGVGAADSQAMARAIKEAGVIFQTGFFRRGFRASRTLKSLVTKGALGRITRVREANMHHGVQAGWFDGDYRWMANPAQSGMGAFGDMGAHSLDFLIWLLGEAESVTGLIGSFVGRYENCDETGEALIKFKNGVYATIGAGWLDLGNPISTIVSGVEGFAFIQDNALYLNKKGLTGKEGFQPYSEFDNDLPHAFDLFLDAVNGREDVPLVSVGEAAHGSAVMEAIYQASAARKCIEVCH